MVLSAAETTAFFQDATDMAIPNATRIAMQLEGITAVEDLADFTDDDLKLIADNLRRPPGRIADPRAGQRGVPAGATIPTPAFTFGAKSQLRIKAASDIVRYYETVEREITAPMMRWNPIVKNFSQHWKTLRTRMQEDKPSVPKIVKGMHLTKWSEAFLDFLSRYVGRRSIPLSYVTRETVALPVTPPPLLPNLPYSEAHGSVEGELVARASHTHPNYRDDNQAVYFFLEEATRSTSYAASISPFQRSKNGRDAFMAIVNQYAGVDKWQAELKKCQDIMNNREWKGQSNFTLEKFVSQHRCAYVSMSQCARHIDYQLPNEHTRVTFLLDNINCDYAPLQAAMALVRNDTDVAIGKMHDFEGTASFIMPHDPVIKKKASNDGYTISEMDAKQDDDDDDVPKKRGTKRKIKTGTGKTGVALRFHTKSEYAQLNPAQMKELYEFRNPNGDTKGGDTKIQKTTRADRFNKKLKGMISEALASDEKETPLDDDTLKNYILSVVESKAKEPTRTLSSTTASAPTINSILKNRLK